MKTSTPITTLPPSPADDRHARMRRYLLATGIRIVCIIFCFVIPLSWWTLIPVFGAVVIPYVAVVLANVGHESGQDVERPGGLEVYRGPQEPWAPPAPHDLDDDPVVGSDGVAR